MRFPTARVGRQTMEFFPSPYQAPLRAFAALVIPWRADEVLICDIVGRGWCIPSGRVEPFESSQEAAVREAREEAGAELARCLYLGCYKLSDGKEVRWADLFVGEVRDLGEILTPQESRGCQWVDLTGLPETYYLWNDLTEAVFAHSKRVINSARAFEAEP